MQSDLVKLKINNKDHMSRLRYESKAVRKMLPRYPLCSAAHFTHLQIYEDKVLRMLGQD